jgi:hypothetical protein
MHHAPSAFRIDWFLGKIFLTLTLLVLVTNITPNPRVRVPSACQLIANANANENEKGKRGFLVLVKPTANSKVHFLAIGCAVLHEI